MLWAIRVMLLVGFGVTVLKTYGVISVKQIIFRITSNEYSRCEKTFLFEGRLSNHKFH